MIRIRRILVPVDFSPDSEKAVRYGIEIGRSRNSQVFFLNVLNQRIVEAMQELAAKGYTDEFHESLKKMVEERERELRAFVPEEWRAGLPCEFLLRKGRPAEEIIAAAKEFEIDLVIIGTHGRSPLASRLMGSVAHAIVSEAPCPVLLVRPIAHDFIS